MNGKNNKSLALVSAALSGLLILGALMVIWLLPRDGSSVSAQTASDVTKPAQITVVGTGSISAKPDILKITIGVSQQESTVQAAQTKVDSTLAAMTAKLKEAGIDEKDYRTAQYSVEPVMDFDGTKGPFTGKLTGFRVVNMVEVTFRNPSKAASVLDTLVNAGANTVYGTNFTLSNPDALAQQAYDAAMKDAQTRAEKLASLSNMKLGKIVSVSESAAAPSLPIYNKGMGAGSAGDFAPGQQVIQTSLIVTYEASAK